ncbi:uncharacterized protein LOC124366616 [Homalodisca vitripennis]|uniref:uncharacterized protein LOC124366616 n=1 Tax=Homalodisca vitripennis TaxID=197043 RepID=UPI001EEB9490|nr:uncharacterized protein LOC124366616 [Homalodisca vitripennis]
MVLPCEVAHLAPIEMLLLQKKAIRLMAGLGMRDSCRTAFRDLGILTVVLSYILAACSRGKDIVAELKNYGKQFEEFRESLQMFSDTIDKANENMKKLTENYKELKSENQQIRASNKELREEVDSLKMRMRQIEQYSRKSNIEIQGVPVTSNEDPVLIAVDVGRTVGVELKAEDVMAAHRVPTFKPRAIPPLIVQLRDRRLKNTCIAAYKKNKKLSAKDINPAFPNNIVYVNDHLTPETKSLLRLAKMKAKEINYKYVWCNDGKIFMRSEDGQRCIRIDCEQDLCKIK